MEKLFEYCTATPSAWPHTAGSIICAPAPNASTA